CKELKRSIYLLKSSTSERDGTARLNTLDKALELSLEGTRERMKEFASGLYLPTMVIYSIGVLLPLVLLAVLPALSIIELQIGTAELALSYCVIIPLTVYGLGKYVLAKRPASFLPPELPVQGGPSWSKPAVGVIAIVPFALGFWLELPPIFLALLMLWGLTMGITTHLYLNSAQSYRLQLKNERVEEEFCDALVQLGNQMSEGRPAEDAFRRAAETSRGSSIAEIFERTSVNVRLGGMRLHSAFFDPDEGALRGVYSPTIRGTLQMLLDALEKGPRAAGQTILRTARHLKELKGMELEVRRSFGEVVSSMRSVALFFAPLVAAVTARLQELLTTKASGVPFLGGGASISFAALLSVLGFYVIVLTSILMSYSVEIERGDAGVLKRFAIARALPVAMGVFTFGVIISGQVFSFMLG
ncbi:MAG: type II secretion system F family protein, partial [Candidatus Hadarchaeota archaeon]|nr:type II secretion system F family protein [Candidatus Hadarchaeota archaeon]